MLHAAAPLIAVWDDHEFSNDAWMRGAENHAFDGSEGTFSKRRAAAIRAYMEWMPIREQTNKRKIYRQFQNKVINLMMLDTRQFGRDKHCLLYTSPSPRDQRGSRMPSSA